MRCKRRLGCLKIESEGMRLTASKRNGRDKPGHDNEERYCRNQLLNGRLSRRRSLAG